VKRKGYAVYWVNVGSIGGSDGIVTFAVSGLPAASTAAFVPSAVTGAGGALLAVQTTQKTPPGTYPLSIRGLSGSLRHDTTVGSSVRK
jgi:hypothetical protein